MRDCPQGVNSHTKTYGILCRSAATFRQFRVACLGMLARGARVPLYEVSRQRSGRVSQDVAGKVALITGASRGIGAATAQLLAAQGARVAINYRSRAARAEKIAAQIAEAGGEAFPIQADVTDAPAVSRMIDQIIDRWGHLDILVLNASGGMEKDMP
ncbi:MAG TPA: SDR family NAD(P)-dependent oxidoreductase, partial [Pseudoclavibacter sp.]|nr:SDR family NAD(P)-dependent oxidoreductase [Pseudoclavibacter sp.]